MLVSIPIVRLLGETALPLLSFSSSHCEPSSFVLGRYMSAAAVRRSRRVLFNVPGSDERKLAKGIPPPTNAVP